MAFSSTLLLLLVAMFVFSAVAQSPASSPEFAAAPPKTATPSPSSSMSPPAAAPSPSSSVVSSPPSPPTSVPASSPSSISSPPSDAPAPSENAAVSNGFAAVGSVVVGLVAAASIM
ncbi:hypothetical protein HKD37_15G041893 [Glycine soja]